MELGDDSGIDVFAVDAALDHLKIVVRRVARVEPRTRRGGRDAVGDDGDRVAPALDGGGHHLGGVQAALDDDARDGGVLGRVAPRAASAALPRVEAAARGLQGAAGGLVRLGWLLVLVVALDQVGRLLLDAIGVPERVDRVVRRRDGRGDGGDHGDAAVRSHEGVAQDHRELGGAKRDVGLVRGEAADALLQGEQALVDLRGLGAQLARVRPRVGAALRAGQVDQGQFPDGLGAAPQDDLADGVRARRGVVRLGALRRPQPVPPVYRGQQGLRVRDALLGQVDHVHFALAVLEDLEPRSLPEQVLAPSAVYLEEADADRGVSRQQLEDVARRAPLYALHRVRLARPGLAVREDGGAAFSRDDEVHQRSADALVDPLRVDELRECVIEHKFRVRQVLGDAVDFVSTVVDDDDGIGAAHGVVVVRRDLALPDRPLAHANAELLAPRDAPGLAVEGEVRRRGRLRLAPLGDHPHEVRVPDHAELRVPLLLLPQLQLPLLHLLPPLEPLLLHRLDLVQGRLLRGRLPATALRRRRRHSLE
mmetsp:Transcript_19888/g.62585  ORF Transcript_19888/g.62585 Transcript_19888/m.62585 type:complete len:536 (-) Transcript_19888:53-1660(-)